MIIMIMIFSLTISFQVLFLRIIYSINKHMLVRQCIVHTKTRHHAQRINYANQVKQLYSNQAPACSRDDTTSVMWHFCPLMFPLKSLLGSYKKGRNIKIREPHASYVHPANMAALIKLINSTLLTQLEAVTKVVSPHLWVRF